MKTALQEVFSEIEKDYPNLFNVYSNDGKTFINKFAKYIELEKQQIMEAYQDGCIGEVYELNCTSSAEQYYNNKYKK